MNKPVEIPEILSDEELLAIYGTYVNIEELRKIAQAQRDDTWEKATEYYEAKIEEAKKQGIEEAETRLRAQAPNLMEEAKEQEREDTWTTTRNSYKV